MTVQDNTQEAQQNTTPATEPQAPVQDNTQQAETVVVPEVAPSLESTIELNPDEIDDIFG